MSIGNVSYNPTISISVNKAKQLYGVTEEELKLLNTNGDDKITIEELRKFGLNRNTGLTAHFNSKTNGALLAAEKEAYVQNPNSIKNNFMRNHNSGQLSPRVNSDLAETGVGMALPLLYG